MFIELAMTSLLGIVPSTRPHAAPAAAGQLEWLMALGAASVAVMLFAYVHERITGHGTTLVTAFAAAAAAAYGFALGAWPLGIVQVIWAGASLRRWQLRWRAARARRPASRRRRAAGATTPEAAERLTQLFGSPGTWN